MLFNSIEFLIFFPIVVMLYFVVPVKAKNPWLLIASYYFYMSWNPVYALLIIASTVTTFFTAYLIIKPDNEKYRKYALILNIVINLSILFFFKYYDFLNDSIAYLLSNIGVTYMAPAFSFLLPVGISFYTFQALGYSIDVYRKEIEHEHNFLNYALFVSFFPQLVAGPIERSKNLLSQFQKTHSFEYERVVSGLRLMLWGFFKKIVIADNLAAIVSNVYNSPDEFTGIPLIVATLAFTFQIFCDFSGYSDIAIGAARILGINLMKNFDRPYHSTSIREFWSRWHISLSTWFRDYVYIPLGGNKVPKWRWVLNIMITFMVSGLWHGANWTFVIWGALHGLYLVVERYIGMLFEYLHTIIFHNNDTVGADIIRPTKIENDTVRNDALIVPQIVLTTLKFFRLFFGWIITFTLVVFAWIFFRANTLPDAIYIVENLFVISPVLSFDGFLQILDSFRFDKAIRIIVLPALALMIFIHILQHFYAVGVKILQIHTVFRILIYFFIITYMLFLGNYGEQQFIYFQF